MGRWSGSALAFPARYGGTLQVLSMYLESLLEVKRVSICSEVTRSVVPGCDCWLLCAQAAWPSDRLDMVCELIRGQLGHGIRTPGDVKLVVDPSLAFK